MRKFWELIIELLADSSGQEGESFKQPFDIGVGTWFREEPGHVWPLGGELGAHFAQPGKFVLVVLGEHQVS